MGLSGAERDACVALCTSERVLGICEQERVTRVRGAGFNRATNLPDEALDELLRRASRGRSDIAAVATPDAAPPEPAARTLSHHFAHACAAFLPSPFDAAAIVVCDREPPYVSVWTGSGASITPVDWPWEGIGFAQLYSECARILGFAAARGEQRMEALARYEGAPVTDTTGLMRLEHDRIQLAPDWKTRIEAALAGGGLEARAAVAAGLQGRVADMVVDFAKGVARRTGMSRLCVAGSLFFNSSINSCVKRDAEFDHVHVPIDPGDAGLALGVALRAGGIPRQTASPFFGPSYTPEEIKFTLDNCKLTYECLSEPKTIDIAVSALTKGRLVAWFDGPMEWGPRALGARSILANPFAPYVLENLNRFLKHRDPWRGYALSVPLSAIHDHFIGPDESPYMECDFVARDRELFRHVFPGRGSAVRVQTVESSLAPRFSALLDAFGQASGLPILVNTSFNGFQEPIVCSPRDAIRVFFGTGIDLMILGNFVLAK